MASKLGFEPEPHWWGGCKGFWWCGFAPFLVRFGGMFILSCGIAVLQNQAVCSIQKFSGNFNAVCGFPMSLCAVFIPISVRFCGIHTPLTPPSLVEASTLTVAKFMICEGQKQSPGEPCIFYHWEVKRWFLPQMLSKTSLSVLPVNAHMHASQYWTTFGMRI